MNDENAMEPKLNLLNLAGGLSKLVDVLNKVSKPETLEALTASGKLSLADIEKLMAQVKTVANDVSSVISEVQAALGE
jgi:hypothetical protein